MHRPHRDGKAYAENGSHLVVAAHYWRGVIEKDPNTLCNFTFFEPTKEGRWQFDFLNETIQIDLDQRSLLRRHAGRWQTSSDPLLMLVTVIYLYHVNGIFPLGKDIVGIQDLKESSFFTGPHELRTAALIAQFKDDLEGFRQAGAALKGKPMAMADVAFEVRPFPRVPLYFLLWRGDAEFKPRLQVLLDRSIEQYLAADAIWALINRTARAIVDTQSSNG